MDQKRNMTEIEANTGMVCTEMRLMGKATGLFYEIKKGSIRIGDGDRAAICLNPAQLVDLESDLFSIIEAWQQYIAGEPVEGALVRLAREGTI